MVCANSDTDPLDIRLRSRIPNDHGIRTDACLLSSFVKSHRDKASRSSLSFETDIRPVKRPFSPSSRDLLSNSPSDISITPDMLRALRNRALPDVTVSRHDHPQPESPEPWLRSSDVLIKQPATRPITEEQMINEVKGIYAGLVMVEKKCIEITARQSSSPKRLSDQQWRALTALHRTLLQEHHDFFLASHHPTASESLKKLAIKYAMPARMWRHGIHTFLELLLHRLPDSTEHMLSFIYLSYSMMALLKESVPSFVETWIECLGDLARYRMAIEDRYPSDREIWANVARMWYNEAADTLPTLGRIQHHLAVLARPNVIEQLSHYSKALTEADRSINACESIMMLFDNLAETMDTADGENHECCVNDEELLNAQRGAVQSSSSITQTGYLQMFGQLVLRLTSRVGLSIRRLSRKCLALGVVVSLLSPVYGELVGHVESTAGVAREEESNHKFALLILLWAVGSLVTIALPILAPKFPITSPIATSSILAFVAALALTIQGGSILSNIWYALCTGVSLGSSLWLGRLTRSPTNTVITTFVRYVIPAGILYLLLSGSESRDKNSRLDLSAAVPCLSVLGSFGLNAFVNEKMRELGVFILWIWERILGAMGLERRRVFEMA